MVQSIRTRSATKKIQFHFCCPATQTFVSVEAKATRVSLLISSGPRRVDLHRRQSVERARLRQSAARPVADMLRLVFLTFVVGLVTVA
jgi:hypothetical protein